MHVELSNGTMVISTSTSLVVGIAQTPEQLAELDKKRIEQYDGPQAR